MRVGVVDVGTNTVRLLIADVVDGVVTDVERVQKITRLGKNVDQRKRLDAVAAKEYVEKARAADAERIRVAGTSALRDAEDAMQFVRVVQESCGEPLDILTGLTEGRLSFMGAVAGLPDDLYMVCDIGGGSTELTVGREGPTATVSLDVGSVRLTERFLRTDPPSGSQVQAALSKIGDSLEETNFELMVTREEKLVGVGGTITTMAALALDLREYDSSKVHHSRVAASDVSRASERLRRMKVFEIRRMRAVEPARADVITGGSLIMRFVMDRWGYDEVLVSEHDILDGMALDLSGNLAQPPRGGF